MMNSKNTIINKINKQKLRIISVNVNSIIQHQRRSSLINLIKKCTPDVVLLNETKLNKKYKLEILNYNVIRKDRTGNNFGGGVAILIKKEIKYEVINNMQEITPKAMENLSIKIKINRNNNLIMTTVYAPASNREKFEKEFDELFQKLELSNTKNYYIIAGDLNAKHKRWKNNSYNTRGNQIDKWLEKNDLKYRIQLYNTDIPTYPRGESYLDICIADQRLHFQTINNNELKAIPYDSDHNAVLMDIKNTLDSDWTLETNTETHKKNFNKTNWEKFKKSLIQQHKKNIPDNINLNRNEIDNYIVQLEEEINDIIETVVPNIKKNKCQTDCYRNKKIKNLEKYKSSIITNINKIYRAMNNKNNHYILRLKIILKNIRKKLKQEYKNSINKYWREKIKSITSNNSKKMFPIIN